MIYCLLFIEFFKTGLFSIGGGLATIPFLKEIALRYDWFSPAELTNMLAVSESTPGAIGVNMATYSGFHAAGVLGALVSTFGLILPSILIILLIARALTSFQKSKLVQRGFYGLRPAAAGLVLGTMAEIILSIFFRQPLSAGLTTFLSSCSGKSVLLFLAMLLCMHKLPRLHPVVWIACGAVAGILFRF